ncbi:hypothetical protein IH970_13265, partial [candidate division KSB1 bacterium]|nr:hypothetical protein [candidate division KSB1 bacterium]
GRPGVASNKGASVIENIENFVGNFGLGISEVGVIKECGNQANAQKFIFATRK